VLQAAARKWLNESKEMAGNILAAARDTGIPQRVSEAEERWRSCNTSIERLETQLTK